MPNFAVASTYTSLRVHVIFATKERKSFIDATWRAELHAYLGGALKTRGATPLAIGGVEDHVHLLFGFKATHAISDIVRDVKTASSEWASMNHEKRFQWQEGYAAFVVSTAEKDRISNYIANQEEHHRTVSSADELLALLEEFEVPYDKRFFE